MILKYGVMASVIIVKGSVLVPSQSSGYLLQFHAVPVPGSGGDSGDVAIDAAVRPSVDCDD